MSTMMLDDPPGDIGAQELSLIEVARRLGKSRWYVSRQLIAKRRIAYRKEGREYRISEAALAEYIESTRRPAAPPTQLS